MNAVPKVAVVILHYAGVGNLRECLSALAVSDYKNFEIVLVHNGGPSAELEKAVLPYGGRIAGPVNTGVNAGFAAGNNAGIKLALERGADYLLLLNDDAVVPPEMMSGLLAAAAAAPAAGMLGPEVLYYSDRERISFRGAKFDPAGCSFSFPLADELSPGQGGEPFESDFLTGCALLVKREVTEKIGLLDERYFLYWEDCDWCFRARAAGFRCLVVPAVRAWHKVSASSGGTASALKAYHKTRSGLYFAAAYARAALPRLLCAALKDAAWLLLRSRGQDRLRKAGAYAAGAADYLRGRRGEGPAWLTRKK